MATAADCRYVLCAQRVIIDKRVARSFAHREYVTEGVVEALFTIPAPVVASGQPSGPLSLRHHACLVKVKNRRPLPLRQQPVHLERDVELERLEPPHERPSTQCNNPTVAVVSRPPRVSIRAKRQSPDGRAAQTVIAVVDARE